MPVSPVLPEGACLLHIGPHKTGTTAIQSAFHAGRKTLAEQGIVYAGKGHTPMRAVVEASGIKPMKGEPEVTQGAWRRLVSTASDTGGGRRTVISSEFFADADADAINRIVADLGPDRVHVVVTLRRLDRIAPSQWQQYIQNGIVVPHTAWLEGMLRKPPYNRPTPSFWRRHRHDQLVERWEAVVGADRVTVVVVDESDQSQLMRTFEEIVGATSGTLQPEENRTNRSLTMAEAELLRAFNVAFQEKSWSGEVYKRYVRLGATREMKARTPGPRERRPRIPAWALQRFHEVSLEVVQNLHRSGARVIGDLDDLIVPAQPEPGRKGRRVDRVAAQIGARALVGAIAASHGAGSEDADQSTDPLLADVSTRTLIDELRDRLVRKLRR